MKQKRILITSGGTIEPIDDIRHIGNFSSGTTGAILAEKLLEAGHIVYYLHSKDAKQPFERLAPLMMNNSDGVHSLIDLHKRYESVKTNLIKYKYTTFDDYKALVAQIIEICNINTFISVAAVSDFNVRNRRDGKIESKYNEEMTLNLVRNVKVIDIISGMYPDLQVIGFKLGSKITRDELIEKAMKVKADYVCANLLSKNMSDRLIQIADTSKGSVGNYDIATLPDAILNIVEGRI